MKKLTFFMYMLSFFITALFFVFMNAATQEVSASSRSGNGNPFLFPLVFIHPFILFFLYGTIDYSGKWVMKGQKKRIKLGAFLAIGTAALIFIFTILRIGKKREEIARINDTFTDASQVSALNIYTNDLFFNGYTFIGVVLLCFFISSIQGLVLKKRKEKQLYGNR